MTGRTIADFLHMGGYGLYVWGSLGMCAAALLAEVIVLRARRLSLRREAALDTQETPS